MECHEPIHNNYWQWKPKLISFYLLLSDKIYYGSNIAWLSCSLCLQTIGCILDSELTIHGKRHDNVLY